MGEQEDLNNALRNAKTWTEYMKIEHDKIYLQATYNTVAMIVDEWVNLDLGTLEIMKEKLGKQVRMLGTSKWVKEKPINEQFKKDL